METAWASRSTYPALEHGSLSEFAGRLSDDRGGHLRNRPAAPFNIASVARSSGTILFDELKLPFLDQENPRRRGEHGCKTFSKSLASEAPAPRVADPASGSSPS